MNQRREPTISAVPHAREDANPGKRQAKRPSYGIESERITQAKEPQSSMLPVVALVIGIIGVGIGGFGAYLANATSQKLVMSNAKLTQADARIAELEKKLSIADGESTQSLTAIQAQVRENISEIRKLWGVSYDRNRNAIAKLDKDTKAALSKLDKETSSEKTRLTKVIANLRSELSVLKDVQEAGQSALVESKIASQEQIAKLGGIDSRVAILETNLNKRIADAEEAIQAIDSFRLQVNRDLLQLKGLTQNR